MTRSIASLLVLGAIALSCVAADPPAVLPPPEGAFVQGACMCALCLDQPFCWNPLTNETVFVGDLEPCPSGAQLHSTQVGLINHGDPNRPKDSARPELRTNCIAPSGNYDLNAPANQPPRGIANGHFSYMDGCRDLPRQCRSASCTEGPDPNQPACSDPQNELGPVRWACGAVTPRVGDTSDPQFFTALTNGENAAIDKLDTAQGCRVYDQTPPTGGVPKRFCYLNAYEKSSCEFGGSRTCGASCTPVKVDPPFVAVSAHSLRADESQSGINLNVVVVDSNNNATSYPGSTAVGGDIALELSDDCRAAAPNNQMVICSRAALTALRVDSVGSFTIAKTQVQRLRTILNKPVLLQGKTTGNVTMLMIPAGTELGASADVSILREGSDFTSSTPLMLEIDWSARSFHLFGTVTESTNKSSMFLNLNGPIANHPPIARAGADQILECASPNGTPALLSAAQSSDEDGQGDIATYSWRWTTLGTDHSADGVSVSTSVSLGTTRFSLQVGDRRGAFGYDDLLVTSRDTLPPSLTLSSSPSCLWPPNHKMVLFELGKELGFSTSDVCDASPKVEIISVTTDQPTNPPDFSFGKRGLCLRSERDGNLSSGRHYKIRVRATDASSNVTEKDIVVTVPHDQSQVSCPNVPKDRLVEDSDPRCTKN